MTDECPEVAPLPDRPPSMGGMCGDYVQTADERENARRFARWEVRHHALWNVANRLRESEARGPSLFDDGDERPAGEEVAAAWRAWNSLTGNAPEFQLAWCVGVLRLLGVKVESNAGAPRIVPGFRKADDLRPVLDLLRVHREAVVEQLKRGLPFDSIPWQLELIRRAAGEWPVWGYRAGWDGRASVYPVLIQDVPPFYDALQVYRPDCFRAIPDDARIVARADRLAASLPPGAVYIGPAFEEYPDGRGEAAHAELKIRKTHGLAFNLPVPVTPTYV